MSCNDDKTYEPCSCGCGGTSDCNCDCNECAPVNCIEQAVNDALSTKTEQLEDLTERAETAAEASEASADASAASAAESKEFRDEAELAATTATDAMGTVVGVANTLEDTANKLKEVADELNTAIAGISVATWYYTAVSDNQTVIPVPPGKNQVDVQAIYIEGARQEPNRGFTYSALNKEITLAEGIPLGMEIAIIIGTYSDNSNDFANTLRSDNGASLVGTSSGNTVQEELDSIDVDIIKLKLNWAIEAGYADSGFTFQSGGTLGINDTKKVVYDYESKTWYSWGGTLPKVVSADTNPADDANWKPQTDPKLRDNLINIDGEKYIGICPDVSTLRTIEPTVTNQKITVRGYYSNTPGQGGGEFIAINNSVADDGVNIFVTAGGKRWKRTGSHIDIPVENGGMMTTRTAEQNSDAFERLTACLPHTGGTIILNGFYKTKYGAIVPPRVTLMGAGMDSCGLVKTGNDIKTVPDRMWQGAPHSFSKDFIAAVDMDSDTTGNLDGNQTRSTRIIGLSLLCTAPNPSEFGIYSAISYDVRLEDLYIHNIKTGYRTSDSWLQTVSNVTIKDCQDGYVVDVGGTTFNLSNIYVRNVSRWAYKFTNITYSNLTCCAADFVNGSAYVFLGCTGVVMNGCGAESVTGSIFEVNQSRLALNAFRAVGPADGGTPALIFTQSGITMTDCFFPEFSAGFTSKYWQVGETTINLIDTVAPDASRVSWGGVASYFNYLNFNGSSSIWGTSVWTATGYRVNGIPHVYSGLPPDSSVTQFGVGARWELSVPTPGQPYKWVYVGGGVWKVAGSIVA